MLLLFLGTFLKIKPSVSINFSLVSTCFRLNYLLLLTNTCEILLCTVFRRILECSTTHVKGMWLVSFFSRETNLSWLLIVTWGYIEYGSDLVEIFLTGKFFGPYHCAVGIFELLIRVVISQRNESNLPNDFSKIMG